MAALCPGVQYGLSSQGNFGENKDLIFVKLTDSAYRAIEEYFKNQNKFSQSPTIQFLGNEGQLSFPSEHGSNGCASFNFSISSTADMEGPGGSFECVQQQCGPQRSALEVLGALPHKMRIHANDDVYEATRQRMTVAEENHKNKCTRVIKPNQTDIGRKVKVKQTPGRSIPIPKRDPLPPTNNASSLSLSKPSSYHHQSSSSSSSSNNAITSKPPPASSNAANNASAAGAVHSSNGLGSNHVTSSRPQNKPSTRDSDIMRRPIKERLIHLLALRPYKKPELIERINRDGREKNVLTTVLKQIAFMRDNTYHLHQHIWNDVNDDWPYYTEQEKQLLKRRKPQNLTPPGSSDGGSSGSGQSPTSTHPGSPPPPVTSSVKRPGYYDGADGLPTKRQRISHYRKPEPASSYSRPAAESNAQRRPATDSRDASNMNPRSREPLPLNGYANHNHTNHGHGHTNHANHLGDKRHYSDEEAEPVAARKQRACDSHSLSYGVGRDKSLKENSICASPGKTPTQDADARKESAASCVAPPAAGSRDRERTDRSDRDRDRDRDRVDRVERVERERERGDRGDRDRERSERGERDRGERDRGERERGERERGDRLERSDRGDKDRMRWNKVSSTTHNGNNVVARVSPDSQADRILPADSRPPASVQTKSEFPDYLTEYTTIKNVEQRRRYKADFNADYTEYRDLHAVVERVSRRFAQLEERLKQEDKSTKGYKDIQEQIVRDYRENQRDVEYQKAKRRFQYLHDKLSHIKRLVLEYDQGAQPGQKSHCARY